jgi:hypothetical protein
VRVRLGTGQILVNGRPANEYFAREALLSMINQPIEIASVGGRYDVIASIGGGSLARAPCARDCPGHREARSEPARRAQAKRTADARCAPQGAQEVRPARGPRALPVLEALDRLSSVSPLAGIPCREPNAVSRGRN